MGDFYVDLSHCVALGMPPAAFGRQSPQSDKLQSLMANPFFMVKSVASCLEIIGGQMHTSAIPQITFTTKCQGVATYRGGVFICLHCFFF